MFDFEGRRAISVYVVENAVENETNVASAEQVDQILTLTSTLVADQDDGPKAGEWEDPEEFAEEQGLMGRLIHLLASPDPDMQYNILSTARKHFGTGGPLRIGSSLPPIVIAAYRLVKGYHDIREEDEKWGKKGAKIFQFCHATIAALVKADMAELPLRMYLQGALALDKIPYNDQETMAYEFMSQAFSLYEDEISDSRAQLAAISLIIGTLEQTTCFSEENHDPLRTQCALAGSKLLKKPDQCRGVMVCSHLFWTGKTKTNDGEELRDVKRVLDCLKKGVKIASQCMDPGTKAQLYIELLNKYIFFSEKGHTGVSDEILQELVKRISEELPNIEAGSDEADQVSKHFENTMSHIKVRQENAEEPTFK